MSEMNNESERNEEIADAILRLSVAERLVLCLNSVACEQTESESLILSPFQYLSSGDEWAIEFMGTPLANNREQGGLDEKELLDYLVEEGLIR
jgi:hypothetical protein